DRAIIHAIAPALDAPRPEKPTGREAAIQRAAFAARQVGNPRIVLLLDRNGFTSEQLDREVHSELEAAAGGPIRRSGPWFTWDDYAVRLVLAGLPTDPLLGELGVVRFTSDDYILKLLLTDEALRSFCAGESHLSRMSRLMHQRWERSFERS